jgi:ABC-2 type transport system ATP-binding protein
MTSNEITVKLDRVTKRFGDFTAVKDLSLSVRAGRVFGLLGPNGAGKSTTIRMIVNITAPDSGSIHLFGQVIDSKLQDRIGYLPEERGLYRRMKVADQLKFFASLKGISRRVAEERIDSWLARLKLSDWKTRNARDLSKGMQQKIQFISAVLHDPDLIILDEPFSGLDPVNVELLKDVVIDLKRNGKTVIFSTHAMNIAEKICDDICLLNRSKKVLDGSIREVKKSFGRNAVALRFEGNGFNLEQSEFVANVEHHSDELEVLLKSDANPQSLLKQLVESGASVTKFEMIEPSLNDIFIASVGATE